MTFLGILIGSAFFLLYLSMTVVLMKDDNVITPNNKESSKKVERDSKGRFVSKENK